ncbi:MAG TPA: hypothetical protein VKA53_05440 [Thermoanaerobaculia bacterium]|nr:hypothetical protein [Thermoanaerobaculia bacterium]
MPLREIITLFGADVDKASFERGDAAIEKLRRGAELLGTVFATGILARGIGHFVKMASDVEETSNLIDVSFGRSAQSVIDWSVEAGGRLKRSKFTLRELAAEFGGLTVSLTGSQKTAAMMSTRLSELAVDLTSLRNFTGGETEALRVLQSAMTGETESVKRFGVDLGETALKAEMLRLGLVGNFNELSKAQKAQIRFNIISRDLAFVLGDAANTSNQFANALRGTKEKLKELAIEIGLRILPFATRLVVTTRDLLTRFLDLAEGTKIFETALIVLGSIAAAVAVSMLAPFIPVLAMWAAIGAAIGAVILVAEDLWQFFTGGISLTGRLLARLEERFPGLSDKLEAFKQVGIAAWGKLKDVFGAFYDWAMPKIEALFNADWAGTLQKAGEAWDKLRARVADFLESPIGKTLVAILAGWAAKKLGEMAGSNLGRVAGELLGSSKIPGSKKAGAWLGEHIGGAGGSLAGTIGGALWGSDAAGQIASLIRPGQGGSQDVNSTVEVNQTIIAAPGQSETAVGDAAAKKAADVVTQQNRRTLRALVPRMAGGGA